MYNTSNLYDYYKLDKNELENSVHEEHITKFRRIKHAYSILEDKYDDGNLLDISVFVYNSILSDCDGYIS